MENLKHDIVSSAKNSVSSVVKKPYLLPIEAVFSLF